MRPVALEEERGDLVEGADPRLRGAEPVRSLTGDGRDERMGALGEGDELGQDVRGPNLGGNDRGKRPRIGRLRRAIALYTGDFLADEPYAEWALAERDRLHAVAARALRALADLHVDDPAVAIGYLERLAEVDPLDDDVQRDLLTTWLRLGRKSRAARHYQSFRVRLMREFGERPNFELSHLAAAGSSRERA